jgi:hypothetical protein
MSLLFDMMNQTCFEESLVLKEDAVKMFKKRVLKEGPWHEGGDANSM